MKTSKEILLLRTTITANGFIPTADNLKHAVKHNFTSADELKYTAGAHFASADELNYSAGAHFTSADELNYSVDHINRHFKSKYL